MKSELEVETNFQPTIEVESAESDEEYADDTVEYFEDDRYFDYDATEEGRITIGMNLGFRMLFLLSFVASQKTLQPHKLANEAGIQKLDHVLQDRKITVDCSGAIKEQSRKDDARRIRNKEKSNRATSEQGRG